MQTCFQVIIEMCCTSNHTKVWNMFSCWFEAIGWVHWVPRKHCVSTWLFKALPGTSVFCSTRSMLAFRIGAFPTVGLNLLLLGNSETQTIMWWTSEMWYFSLIHLYDLSLWYRPASFYRRGLTNHVFLCVRSLVKVCCLGSFPSLGTSNRLFRSSIDEIYACNVGLIGPHHYIQSDVVWVCPGRFSGCFAVHYSARTSTKK